MDPRDQVSIHEAMEQQTISLTKAGVKATLNARTSILAAANPIGGRYDRSKSLRQNISLSAPIVSRFDLFFILVDECNEVTDYAIARRILDLHKTGEAGINDKVYASEDIQRYIMFSRLWNPKLTPEAAESLVSDYKQLRARDASGAAMSSWRVTVRQLESMIRLSEAIARLYCSAEVTAKHVKEAYRLLNKSIIRVEQPDIEFNEETVEEVEAVEESMETDQNEDAEINGGDQSVSAVKTKTQSNLKVPFEDYKHLSNLLVLHIREEDERRAFDDDAEAGVRQSELIGWYLNQIQDELESEEELLNKKVLVEKVIERLIRHENVLIKLTQTSDEAGNVVEEEDPILVVHPNYVLEDV